ncbi:MAG: polysaccharide biosynthesis C-terminal domain-containing protein [Candidatus Kapaibacterium sp.]
MLARLKSLLSDTMIYGLFNIVGRFLAFLIYPFYSNYLAQGVIGDISNIFAIIAFLNIIYSFGLESAFFRFYKNDDPEYSKVVFTQCLGGILIVSGLASLAIYLSAERIAPAMTSFGDPVAVVRMAAFIPFFDAMILVPYALLRMTRQAMKFALTRFLLIVIYVVMNLWLVIAMRMGIEGVFLANLISSVSGAVIFAGLIIKHLKFRLDKDLLKKLLRFGIPTIPASLAAIILQVADKPILKSLAGSAELGIYSINYKLGIPMMMMVTIFEYAWKPFYLNYYKEEGSGGMFARVLTYFTMACAGLFLAVSLFIDYIVRIPSLGGPFINPKFWEGLGIVPIILAGYYFNGMFNNFAAGIQISKRTEFFPIAVGAAAAVNIGMNFALIPVFGYVAAAWATLVAYLVSAGVLYIFSRKLYEIKYEWKRIGIIIAATMLVYFGSQIVTSGMTLWPAFFVKIAFLIVFFILLKIMKFFTAGEIARIKKIFRRG